MDFETPLIEARLLRRYKRFLADVDLGDGRPVTVHCPNPGSMMGLVHEGGRCYLSHSADPKRKYAHRLELVEVPGPGPRCLVGIHASLANTLVGEALRARDLFGLGAGSLRAEVPYGTRSRVDFLHEAENGTRTFIEVKNVHLMRREGLAEFPDCVTARGAKHLGELAEVVRAGDRAMLVYCIQWPGAERFSLAADIDPAYAQAAAKAAQAGVSFHALGTKVTPQSIVVTQEIPVKTPV
ncbi:MAG: DNA/RNA nuclease SfsA [Hyphomicrobiaceae bacterium]|nr:DNA/RNA nuclease SfsA [Hyphomicrobiaceae bacterium]